MFVEAADCLQEQVDLGDLELHEHYRSLPGWPETVC